MIGRFRRFLRRVLRRPRLAALLAAVPLVLAAVLSFTRVPEGHLGVAGGRLLERGWHLTSPFARPGLLPVQGRIDAIDVPRRTPEGASFVVRLSFDYRLEASALRPRAALLGAGGLPRAASDAAAGALAPLPAALLLPPVAPISHGATTPLPEA
ncbi:MAG: hypothetical protein ACRD5D_10275, partial [Candidatus Polarisedimenticolia bacterium]